MSEERRAEDPIDVEELPPEGNSNARIYPPADKADRMEQRDEEDPHQPPTGDASAERDAEDEQGRSE